MNKEYREALVNQLHRYATELFRRTFTEEHVHDLADMDTDEICKILILTAAKLKTPIEVDFELCHQDSHYSYCNTLYDLIDDALYVESLPDEE